MPYIVGAIRMHCAPPSDDPQGCSSLSAPLSPTLLEEGPEVEKDTVVGWGWGWGRSHHATWVFLNHCN